MEYERDRTPTCTPIPEYEKFLFEYEPFSDDRLVGVIVRWTDKKFGLDVQYIPCWSRDEYRRLLWQQVYGNLKILLEEHSLEESKRYRDLVNKLFAK